MSNGSSRYQVLKHLASGGMAEVFLAREKSASGIEKLVVLKRVLPTHSKDAEFLRMFRDEGRIGALLQHPNLVQMFEMGTLEGSPFISMEYLNGEDIRSIFRVLRRNGQPMKLDTALTILSGVCAGLHCAHEAVGVDGKPLSIVHRDVSPQNVIVTYEGGVKVVDFGIARSENRLNKTENSVLKGKVSYMAPEQVLGATLDRRVDVYAVGVMLYEMTTGRRPHQADNEVAIIRSILDAPVEPPERLVPGYPPGLSAIVQKAMARERDVRYPTAQALQEALEGFAVHKGLTLSTLALGRTMRELFGERADAYRQVLAGTASPDVLRGHSEVAADKVEEHDVTNVMLGDGPVVPTDGRGTLVESAAFPALDQAEFKRVGPVTLVSFRGKLNEKFSGAVAGGVLSGQVVFDLRRVERVTSFGVREWLQMLAACEPRVSELYLVQCSEPVVSQLSMVKRFAGPGKVLSFYAPYHCAACDQSFQGLLEVSVHGKALQRGEVPQLPCAACGQPADFDDDARSYLAFGPAPLPPLPPQVQAVVDGLQAGSNAAPERVEKFIEGQVTRVKVRAALDASVRWRRVLDGVEGEVAVDLLDVPRVEGGGVRQLATALLSLGEDVTGVRLLGATRPVLEGCAEALRRGRVTVESAVLEGTCPQCNAPRSSVVKATELRDALARRRPPFAPCRRCDTGLALGDISWLESVVEAARSPPPVSGGTASNVQRPAAGPQARTQPMRVAQAPPPKKGLPSWALVGLGVLLTGVGVGVSGLLSRPEAPPQKAPAAVPVPVPVAATPAAAPAAPRAPAAVPAAAPAATPPEWAQGPSFVESAQHASAWARGTAATEAAARKAAENGALARLSQELVPGGMDLKETWTKRFAASALAGEALRAALERRLDGALQLQLSSVDTGSGHEAWARVRVQSRAFTAALVESGRELSFRGATLYALPPHLAPAGGALYVQRVLEATPARAAGLREGDLVLELEGQPVPSAGIFEGLRGPLGQKPVALKVDAQGVPRTLRVSP